MSYRNQETEGKEMNYNCDDCQLNCSDVLNALCHIGLVDDCKQLEAENNRKCKWTPDEDGIYDTDCGGRFEFKEGGPKENQTKYCQYCRGILNQE